MSKPQPAPVARRSYRLGRLVFLRFRRDRDGVVAVELALLALPFFGVIFAILEVALYFWASQTLETMVTNASRAIYTGTFQRNNQAGSKPEKARLAEIRDKFVESICYTTVDGKKQKLPSLFDCAKSVKIDVRKGDEIGRKYPDGIRPPDYDPKQEAVDTGEWGYEETGGGEVVVIRAVVEFPVLIPVFGPGSLPNGKRLIMATAVFRNEPF